MNNLSLAQIAYPVFKLGANKPNTEKGVSFYYYEREDDEGNILPKLFILDDKNLPQESLSLRRMQLAIQDVPLFKISRAIFFLGDLIKLAAPKVWFIDSNGKVFNYNKTTRAKLKFYKIARLLPINSGGAIVEAEGISTRFKSLYLPPVELALNYVGLLHFGKSLVLYGFYDDKYDDTWRMV